VMEVMDRRLDDKQRHRKFPTSQDEAVPGRAGDKQQSQPASCCRL
jgi:hypothetical protein